MEDSPVFLEYQHVVITQSSKLHISSTFSILNLDSQIALCVAKQSGNASLVYSNT